MQAQIASGPYFMLGSALIILGMWAEQYSEHLATAFYMIGGGIFAMGLAMQVTTRMGKTSFCFSCDDWCSSG